MVQTTPAQDHARVPQRTPLTAAHPFTTRATSCTVQSAKCRTMCMLLAVDYVF